MKIILIGHGKLPIPPNGWGGVERVIYDIYTHLTALGHEVEILNLPHRRVVAALILRTIKRGRADLIWCHNERLVPTLMRFSGLLGNGLIETCHSAMTDLSAERLGAALPVRRAAKANVHLSLHPALSNVFTTLNPKCRIMPFKIGVDVQSVRMVEVGNGRAVCLGRISHRKRQRIVADELSKANVPIDFIGPEASDLPQKHRVSHLPCYVGSWSSEEVSKRLTEYSTLVLWSASEVQPSVVIEALAAGLDVVVSPESTGNLDTSLPFVHVVDSLENLASVTKAAISANRERRLSIRQYAEANCDWSAVFEKLSEDMKKEFSPVPRQTRPVGLRS